MGPGAAADAFGAEALAAALAPLLGEATPPVALCIAVSGGADSLALLVAAARLAAAKPRFRVRALHVDHGLSAAAPALAGAASAAALALGVTLERVRVTVAAAPAEGIEAAARAAREAAFAAALAPGECLLTAHHREDQAETLLLQLLRGAGLRGLGAMPGRRRLGAGWLLRPLLDVPRAALLEAARRSGLPWHEDPMNADARFDRAYLRHAIWPGLVARWPAAARTLARSAGHLAAAQRLVDADAVGLLAALARGPALDVDGLLEVALPRRAELLRSWLNGLGLAAPPARRLAQIERELLGARAAARPRMAWRGVELHRFDGRLYAFATLPALPDAACGPCPARPGTLALGALGHLEFAARPVAGLRLTAAAQLAPRRGGERLRLRPGGPRRALKDLLREARLPPWARARAILVRVGEHTAAVVLPHATWIDADWQAGDGEPGWRIAWKDAPAVLMPAAFIEREAHFR